MPASISSARCGARRHTSEPPGDERRCARWFRAPRTTSTAYAGVPLPAERSPACRAAMRVRRLSSDAPAVTVPRCAPRSPSSSAGGRRPDHRDAPHDPAVEQHVDTVPLVLGPPTLGGLLSEPVVQLTKVGGPVGQTASRVPGCHDETVGPVTDAARRVRTSHDCCPDHTSPAQRWQASESPGSNVPGIQPLGRVSAVLPAAGHLGAGRVVAESSYGTLPPQSRDEARANSSTARHLASRRSGGDLRRRRRHRVRHGAVGDRLHHRQHLDRHRRRHRRIRTDTTGPRRHTLHRSVHPSPDPSRSDPELRRCQRA